MKSFSSGILFSVAMLHLLAESLFVLDEAHDALFNSHSEEEEEDHGDHRRFLSEEDHEEEGHDAHEHKFPVGVALCVAGLVFTLGVQVVTRVLADKSKSRTKDHKALPDTEESGSGSGSGSGSSELELVNKQQPVGDNVTLESGECNHGEERACSSACVRSFCRTTLPTEVADDVSGKRFEDIMSSVILESSCFMHAIIIGLTMGSMEDYKELSVFLVAISFHRLLEGVSLGCATFQACYTWQVNLAFMLFYVVSLPVGTIFGMSFDSSLYSQGVQACLQSFCAGAILHVTLVDMVAEDFSLLKSSENGGKVQVDKATAAAVMYGSFAIGAGFSVFIAQWA